MKRRSPRPTLLRASVRAAFGLGVAAAIAAPLPANAATYVAISGSGSSWSAVALDQWQQDLRPNGLVVN